VIETEDELRQKGLPSGSLLKDWALGDVDWLFAATMRDDENVFEDIDDGMGAEAMTASDAMMTWTTTVLGLHTSRITCQFSGELEALEAAQDAVDAGGVAFLAIDSGVIKDGKGDTEENVRWRYRVHPARTPVGTFPSTTTHCVDDTPGYNHWVAFLDDLVPRDPGEEDHIRFRLWSWAGEFEVSGVGDDFGEYLYVVVTGRP
jgi:hypothetical protein